VASSARCRVESGAFTEDTAMENGIPEDSEDETLDEGESPETDPAFITADPNGSSAAAPPTKPSRPDRTP
jgi:hypothetical protein